MEKNKKKYFIEPKLQLIEQKNTILLDFPESDVSIKDGTLTWFGIVRPTAVSKEYTLKLEYKMGKNPRVWLLNADIEAGKAKDIPHHYHVDEKEKAIELCLFKPGLGEWMKHYAISRTIIPWAIEWLYYYEIWKITGRWKGGGAHPTPKDCRNRKKYQEMRMMIEKETW